MVIILVKKFHTTLGSQLPKKKVRDDLYGVKRRNVISINFMLECFVMCVMCLH